LSSAQADERRLRPGFRDREDGTRIRQFGRTTDRSFLRNPLRGSQVEILRDCKPSASGTQFSKRRRKPAAFLAAGAAR
jgi:hypothetical protein